MIKLVILLTLVCSLYSESLELNSLSIKKTIIKGEVVQIFNYTLSHKTESRVISFIPNSEIKEGILCLCVFILVTNDPDSEGKKGVQKEIVWTMPKKGNKYTNLKITVQEVFLSDKEIGKVYDSMSILKNKDQGSKSAPP